MLQLLTRLLTALAPNALKEFAAKLSVSLGRQVPGELKPLLEWIKVNPIKSEIALATLYQVGSVPIREAITESGVSKGSELVQAVIASTDHAVRKRYSSSKQARSDVSRISGDGNSNTVHGLTVQDFNKRRTIGRETDRLIKQAVGIVGSKTNLIILRDAILSLETEEINSYGS